VTALDWPRLAAELDERGFARIPRLLRADACRALRDLYGRDGLFRKRVVLERQRFGRGEYKYFDYPLPDLVDALRRALYPPLADIANAWGERLGWPERCPRTLDRYRAHCRRHGQTRATPLMLHYEAGDYNRLHQDLYGAVAFPLQVTVQLSRPEVDFEGGEFLLVEQRARMQSRGEALALRQGEAVVFPVRERPVASARGFSRAAMRHGVSTLASGRRTTLGIIFHDAK